jgi:hypothetical protein
MVVSHWSCGRISDFWGGGQSWCSAAWSCGFEYFWVNGGVVHGRGFESLRFFFVNSGVVVHGHHGLESLIFGVNGRGFVSLTFGVNGDIHCNNHPQNQQSQPNPTQTTVISPFLCLFIRKTKIYLFFLNNL